MDMAQLDFFAVREDGSIAGYLPDEESILVPPNVQLRETDAGPCVLFPLDGGKQVWELDWPRRRAQRKLATEFTGLADASPESILAFARTWGPLWCLGQRRILEGGDVVWCESIAEWQTQARAVRALIEIAANLSQGKPAAIEAWAAVGELCQPERLAQIESPTQKEVCTAVAAAGVDVQRRMVAALINSRLAIWRIPFFRLSWTGDTPRLGLSMPPGFFPALLYLLAQAIVRASVCICDGCGRAYVREGRRPPRGRYSFCPECGERGKGSKRLSARRRLARAEAPKG